MKVVKQSYEFLDPPVLGVSKEKYFESQERLVEVAGRTCYKSEGSITENSYSKFCVNIGKKRHLAVFEFGSATVKFVTNRGVLAEFTRHRLCSFAVESTRYCNYSTDKFGNEVTFVKPSSWDVYTDEQKKWWYDSMIACEASYMTGLSKGLSPQVARGSLVNDLKTELVVKANFREWLRVFELRCDPSAHPDIVALLTPLRDEMAKLAPSVFAVVNLNRNYIFSCT